MGYESLAISLWNIIPESIRFRTLINCYHITCKLVDFWYLVWPYLARIATYASNVLALIAVSTKCETLLELLNANGYLQQQSILFFTCIIVQCHNLPLGFLKLVYENIDSILYDTLLLHMLLENKRDHVDFLLSRTTQQPSRKFIQKHIRLFIQNNVSIVNLGIDDIPIDELLCAYESAFASNDIFLLKSLWFLKPLTTLDITPAMIQLILTSQSTVHGFLLQQNCLREQILNNVHLARNALIAVAYDVDMDFQHIL